MPDKTYNRICPECHQAEMVCKGEIVLNIEDGDNDDGELWECPNCGNIETWALYKGQFRVESED